MNKPTQRVMLFFALMTLLLCTSCLTMTLPKSARLEGSGSSSSSPNELGKLDKEKTLLARWELLYQVNDKGVQEKPRESTQTLIEFLENGKVVFDRTDKENTDSRKSRSGKFTLVNDEISITDDAGNTVQWPYQISGDTLVLVMPEVQKKFFWRKVR